MKPIFKRAIHRAQAGFFLGATLLLCGSAAWSGESLPSWNEGPARQAIVDFVTRAIDEHGKDLVPPAERIVVFDYSGVPLSIV